MDKEIVRRELDRLIGEASSIAPSIENFQDGRGYGNVTDERLNAQGSERWELEVNAVIGELASSGAKVFVDLNAKYIQLKAESQRFHSRAIFIHKTLLLLQSACELLNSAVAELKIGLPRPLATPDQTTIKPSELEAPQKVTLQWLFKHVPVLLWVGAVSIVISVFIAGVKATEFSVVRETFGLSSGGATPNIATQPTKP